MYIYIHIHTHIYTAYLKKLKIITNLYFNQGKKESKKEMLRRDATTTNHRIIPALTVQVS